MFIKRVRGYKRQRKSVRVTSVETQQAPLKMGGPVPHSLRGRGNVRSVTLSRPPRATLGLPGLRLSGGSSGGPPAW